MALQDLTPQLRTRLGKVERAVGWFVILSVLLLLAAFGYYVYRTAQDKGWFLTKVNYQTGVNNAAGLKVGDPVKLMGFPAGEITDIVPNDPSDYYGVTISFSIKYHNYGYIWRDSVVKVQADFLGNRYLEVTKGQAGLPTVKETTNNVITGILNHKTAQAREDELWNKGKTTAEIRDELKAQAAANPAAFYEAPSATSVCWIEPDEAPALNERFERLASQVEAALPNILALTNRLADILDQGIATAENANRLVLDARPIVANLEQITRQIRDPRGGLGEWLLPPDIRRQLTNTLGSANTTLLTASTTLTNADAQITLLATELDRTLENLSAMTSNLNAQVAANPQLVREISDAIVHADELVQGLKRHWLLRSAFKSDASKPPAPPPATPRAGRSP